MPAPRPAPRPADHSISLNPASTTPLDQLLDDLPRYDPLTPPNLPTALPNDHHLLNPRLTAFTMELAADLEPISTILAKFSYSEDFFRNLAANKVWLGMLQEQRARFQAITSTSDRIKIKAQLITELGLDTLHGIMIDDAAPEAARVSAFRAITPLTGLERPAEPHQGTRFVLKIQLPGQQDAATVIDGEISTPIPTTSSDYYLPKEDTDAE